MNPFYILLFAYNESDYVKLSVQSIRMFADIDNLSVIIVDNNSTDHLSDWAASQQDLTYVYMDEGKLPFGALMNQVISELHIEGDIFIMGAGFLLTPNCLSNMRNALYEDSRTGAVGPLVTPGQISAAQRISDIENYEHAVNWAISPRIPHHKKVIGLPQDPILFRAETLQQLDRFDEELILANLVIRDYCFHMIRNHWDIRVCRNSLVWNSKINNNHVIDPVEQKKLEKKWGMHYFNISYNQNLISMIKSDKDDGITVLEIGCDCGATLLEIQNQYPHAHLYGCEINEKAAEIASLFATVSVNNIEEQTLDYPPQIFDYIIFGDVLEHLRDPLKTIQYCRTFLKSKGSIIASIPNLMHISVMEDLLNGNFTYTETGLLDKTHIHLFTYNEIMRMLQAGGYIINNFVSLSFPVSSEQNLLIDKLLHCGQNTERHMFETFQYVISATPVSD